MFYDWVIPVHSFYIVFGHKGYLDKIQAEHQNIATIKSNCNHDTRETTAK